MIMISKNGIDAARRPQMGQWSEVQGAFGRTLFSFADDKVSSKNDNIWRGFVYVAHNPGQSFRFHRKISDVDIG